MRRILCILLICLLLPVGALAETRRGDGGEEVYEIQQLLFDTGFLFEEPDGVFGRNTEAAVKWFQETWNLPVTGVVTEEDRMAMYDCWHSLFNPDGTLIEGEPLPDDQLEPQPLSPDIKGICPPAVPRGIIPSTVFATWKRTATSTSSIAAGMQRSRRAQIWQIRRAFSRKRPSASSGRMRSTRYTTNGWTRRTKKRGH